MTLSLKLTQLVRVYLAAEHARIKALNDIATGNSADVRPCDLDGGRAAEHAIIVQAVSEYLAVKERAEYLKACEAKTEYDRHGTALIPDHPGQTRLEGT